MRSCAQPPYKALTNERASWRGRLHLLRYTDGRGARVDTESQQPTAGAWGASARGGAEETRGEAMPPLSLLEQRLPARQGKLECRRPAGLAVDLECAAEEANALPHPDQAESPTL